MLVHTQVKAFKCNYCERSFTVDYNRKTHERIHTGEKPYRCTFCSFTAAQNSNMHTHMRSKHKVEMPKLSTDKLALWRHFIDY